MPSSNGPSGPTEDGAGQVALLVPQLGRVGRFLEQEIDDRARRDRLARDADPEVLFGERMREDARVVARTVDGARLAGDAVLLEARRALVDGAREVDAGHRGALPVRWS